MIVKQNDLLPLIVASLADAVLVFDPRGQLVLLNPAARQMFGDLPATLTIDAWVALYPSYHVDQRTPYAVAEHPAVRALHGTPVGPIQVCVHQPGSAAAEPNCWLQLDARPLNDERGLAAGVLLICRDITAEKRAELARYEREQHLHTVIASLPLVLCVADRHAVVTLLAGRLLAQLSLGRTVQVGLSLYELCAEYPQMCADFKRVLSGETVSAIYTVQRFVFEVRYAPIMDAHGAADGMICVAVEISQRQQAEAALRASEDHFRTLIDDLHVGVLIQGPQSEVLLSNRAAREMLGLTEQQLLSRTSYDTDWGAIQEDGAPLPGYLHPTPLAIATERPVHNIVVGVLRHSSRERRWLLANAEPRLNNAGQIEYVVCTFSDITERKQAEAALRESESTLRSFYDSTTLMLGIVELLDDDDILYISNNASAAAFFGLPPSQVDQRRASELRLSRRYRRIWIEHYHESERTGRPVMVEYEQQIGDSTRWLAATVCPIAQSPTDRTRFAYVAEDITERKRSAERISASLREKEVLLQEIHHRVKNNLQVISSLLKLQSAAITDARARDIFQESQHRVRSMALVHEKLYQAPDLTRIDFADYLRSLTTYLVRSYNVSPLLHLDIDAESVLLDVEQAVSLGLIVNELVSNALKYAFPAQTGGQIRIVVRPADAHLSLTISDTGVGLPPEIDLGHTETLGLRLVTMLTRQLGGTIELDTSQGTTFTLAI